MTQASGARVLGRARHLGRGAVDPRGVGRRGGRVRGRRRPAEPTARRTSIRERARGRGRGRGRGHRRARRVRRRVPRARAPGQRALRGQVPARVRAVAAGDRRAPRRVGPPARRRRGRPRLHRQGQRPGALRGVVARSSRPTSTCSRRSACGASPAPTASSSPAKWDIPIEASRRRSSYSIDENMWGRAIECGVLENPWVVAARGAVHAHARRRRTRRASRARSSSASSAGVPVCARRRARSASSTLIDELGAVVGAYGWGRIDMVENRRVGIKSREVYECPASLALLLAHHDLESITLERDLAREKQRLEIRVAELIYDGLWYSPLMRRARRVRRRHAAARHRRGAAAARARPLRRGRPARADAASTTTTSRPTTPRTRSATRTPRASCACGASRCETWSRRQGPGAA